MALLLHMATLDIKPFDGENSQCANCDAKTDDGDDSIDLIQFDVTGTDGHDTTFVVCTECIAEMLVNVSAGRPDSLNVNTPS